ncbi:DUF1760-domain-containing protein [Westerdykella ornata]|uniref:DUF1760-domain-containing protein n=1 Tax=Westerdykella ornata TaxID=318751 RepID=A0A6A6JQW1_WESOR|nr:DUF1760-domain-containing protein [Westerdykella ornata]KAF2278655.1 DUF1760-domain-containing protein [Westerdykella ornata]
MAEESKTGNPLLDARPPATDYLTYLTVVEYNLTEDNLPVLHEVLQDTELTTNIGWDLIHLLLPLLPASEECLEDIAAKGNPRECILKVTEPLRLLDFDEDERDSDEEQDTQAEAGPGTDSIAVGESSSSPAQTPSTPPPHSVLKFQALLALLSTLHGRIKTKYPSRFLSTSLQAVLSAYSKARHHNDELTHAVVKFVNTLSGTKRPHLPPRTSTADILRTDGTRSEPDPEAHSEPPEVEEDTLVNRLLQAFITHILEDYMLSLSSESDVPGLAWASRLMEKYEPHRVVPSKSTYAERFAQEEGLKSRSAIVGQLVAMAQDLGITSRELSELILDPEKEKQGTPGREDEPPASAADIPLSKTGALFLYTARLVKRELYPSASSSEESALTIFPSHAQILKNFIGTAGLQTVGLEPEALLDAVLALGLIALQHNEIGEPRDDEHFCQYLQTMSLISANTASPSLRYQAHYLTSTVLRSHPSDIVRLTFIRDTLEHCPYENLKASAVGWLKGETLEANMPQHSHDHDHTDPSSSSTKEPAPEPPSESESIFSTPVALSTLSPFLFPDLTATFHSSVEISESWMAFRSELGFFLATLNFYYLLLTAKMLHANLDIEGLHRGSNMVEGYLRPLKEAIGRFRASLEEGGELALAEGEDGVRGSRGDLALLEDVVGRVEEGIRGLGL